MDLVETLKKLTNKTNNLMEISDQLSSDASDLVVEVQELQDKISEQVLCEGCSKTIHNEELMYQKIEESPKGWYRKELYLWKTPKPSTYRVELRTTDIKPFNSDQEKEAKDYYENQKILEKERKVL